MSSATPVITQKRRSRSMGGLTAHDYVYSGWNPNGSLAYTGTQPSVTTSGFLKEMNDIVTKGYRSALARGQRVNNPYDSVAITKRPWIGSTTRTFSQGSKAFDSGPLVTMVLGDLYSNYMSNPIDRTSLDRLATLKGWAAVEPAKSQSLVTVLEAHKSWETIAKRARQLANVVEACRRKDIRALKAMLPGTKRVHTTSAMVWDDDGKPILNKRGQPKMSRKAYFSSNDRKYRDEASQLWLEYRYGWSPLVYDMIDSLKAVYAADLRKELLPRDVHKARGKAEATQVVSTPLSVSYGGLAYTGNRRCEFRYEVKTYIHYRWTAPDGILRRLNDFGLFDVPKAVWEVCPFSFIADWFIPIGDWLGAITPKIGVEIIDVGFTTSNYFEGLQSVTGFPSPTVGGITYSPVVPLGSSDTATRWERARYTHLGIPYFPPIDINLNVKRMADVAALFRRMR